jgi:hypothetical protein
MKEFFRLSDVNCVGRFFDDEYLPSRIIVIHRIEIAWHGVVTEFLSQSDYDYIISDAFIEGNEVRRWTTPQKVKMYKRQQKLKELGL